jgi:hypothetical protein
MARPWERYGAGSQSIQTKPTDPTLPLDIEGKRLTNEDRRLGIQDKENDLANAGVQARILEAQAREAEAAARKAETERLGKPLADDAKSIRGNLDSVAQQVLTLEALHRDYLKGGFPNAVVGRLPTDFNDQIETAGRQLLDVGAGAFRVPGSGSQDQKEFEAKMGAYMPRPTDTDKDFNQKLEYLKMRVDNQRKALGVDSFDWNARVAPPGADKTRQSVVNPNIDAAVTTSKGGTRSVEDPLMKGVAGKLGKMVSDGTPDREIYDFLERSGINANDFNVGAALQFRRTPQYRQWKAQNPAKAYPIAPSFYQKEVPLTTGENLYNKAAQSSLGAYAMAAGNAVIGGNLDSAVGATGGNADLARVGMDTVRAENPKMSLAGDITGSTIDQLVLGRIPGLSGGGLLRTVGNDAIYGAASGYGEADGNRALGAVTGGLVNPVAGMLGSAAARTTGAGFRGVRNEATQYLTERGVPLTIGQIARGGRGPVSQAVASVEDRLAGMPLIGDLIGGARRRGVEGFNRAGFDEGLAPINGNAGGATGSDAIGAMQNQTNQAYGNALDGVSVPHDPAFTADLASAQARAGIIPVHGPQLNHTIDTEVTPYGNGGVFSGPDIQASIQRLRGEAGTYRGVPGGNAASDALGGVETAITDLVGRQAPDVMPALGAANAAYRNQSILSNAVLAGKNTDELFTPAQLNNASVTNTKNYGGRNAAAAGNRPFYDLGRHGQEILPSKVPDSGTAGRAALGAGAALLGGGAGALGSDNQGLGVASDGGQGAMKGLGIAALLAAPYSRVGQATIQRILVGDRAFLVDLAGRVVGSEPVRRGAGMFASGATRDALYQGEQPIR